MSVVNLVGALAVYRYLVSGGWLTNPYHLNDPNIVNLALIIFEPVIVMTVFAYWIWRTRFLYRLTWIFCILQTVIGAGFAVFILLFVLTWHPKLM
jgi:hypothetical protein